jgi:hypothetical protein
MRPFAVAVAVFASGEKVTLARAGLLTMLQVPVCPAGAALPVNIAEVTLHNVCALPTVAVAAGLEFIFTVT